MHLIAPIMHLIALGITAVPREIENKACAKFGGWGGGGAGANKVHYGSCASSVFLGR